MLYVSNAFISGKYKGSVYDSFVMHEYEVKRETTEYAAFT